MLTYERILHQDQSFMKFLLSSLIAFSVLIPSVSVAQFVPSQIEKTGTLKIGIRQDSPLFGSGEKSEGYCYDFAKKLAETLSQKGKVIQVKVIPSTTQNRWNLVKTGQVDLECGPNSELPEREQKYNIKFSDPFFLTATQIVMSPSTTEKDLERGKIGVIANTTNEQDIRQVYQPQQIVNTFSTRQAGIQAVNNGMIQGFASDGILLMGTMMDLNLSPSDYNLITPIKNNTPFCAAYSMILPNGKEHQQWRDQVNAVIKENNRGSEIWDQWFLPFVPYMKTVFNSCKVS